MTVKSIQEVVPFHESIMTDDYVKENFPEFQSLDEMKEAIKAEIEEQEDDLDDPAAPFWDYMYENSRYTISSELVEQLIPTEIEYLQAEAKAEAMTIEDYLSEVYYTTDLQVAAKENAVSAIKSNLLVSQIIKEEVQEVRAADVEEYGNAFDAAWGMAREIVEGRWIAGLD